MLSGGGDVEPKPKTCSLASARAACEEIQGNLCRAHLAAPGGYFCSMPLVFLSTLCCFPAGGKDVSSRASLNALFIFQPFLVALIICGVLMSAMFACFAQ